jgi:hypothetical protein
VHESISGPRVASLVLLGVLLGVILGVPAALPWPLFQVRQILAVRRACARASTVTDGRGSFAGHLDPSAMELAEGFPP